MTPEDQPLDPNSLFVDDTITLYRLAQAKYANLSGIGAALAPGRWNQLGQEAIYTSIEKGVPLLERLAHTPKDLIPSNLAMMTIRLMGDWTLRKWHVLDPHTNDTSYVEMDVLRHEFRTRNYANGPLETMELGTIIVFRTIAEARARLSHGAIVNCNLLGIAVPSVIVPVWNVVLYPAGTRFWTHVTLENVERFDVDPRLFPDDTPIEAQS